MLVHENVSLEWGNMLKGIRAQGHFVRTQAKPILASWSSILDPRPLPGRAYLVGCGDSYFCGISSELAFKMWAGVDCRAMESLEFSRYEADWAPEGSWIVATSNSGRVARTVECVVRGKARRHLTFGVSYNTEGRLGQEADGTVFYKYEDTGFGPGTISYTASLIAQYVLAAYLAERTGKGGTEALMRKIESFGTLMDTAVESTFDLAGRLGELATKASEVVIMGGGPNYGSALFGMAKQIESAKHNTTAQELEEWAHEQYFCTKEGTVTIVIAPPGAAADRAREQLQAVRDMGGHAAVICSEADAETQKLADTVLAMPDTAPEDECLTPLLYQIPLQIFSYSFAQAVGAVMLGFDDKNRMEVNFRQIFGSNIVG
ncbi:SIS domain-containing protein [Paenibacillus humicola]|uniref:SIS domain-containing protein n=1 Tax=Paenibacillus humicola TaxID=3110540 RepID=UPI00237BB5AF|nr:SIS domain-containing protein [Paenibacillus humicola]